MRSVFPNLLRPAIPGGLACLLLGVAAAQTAQWSSPTLGFVFDADSKSIRSLSGVVGAASLDGALAIPVKLESASLSPNRQLALAASLDSDHLVAVRWSGKATSTDDLAGSLASMDLVAWSPDGNSAAIYNGATVQIWKLGANPELALQADMAGVSAMAIADDGFAVASTDAGLLTIASEPKLLSDAHFAALAFGPGTHDLAASDTVLNQVSMLHASDNSLSVLASASDGLGHPLAVSFSRDGQKLAVANSDAKSILLIDLASGNKQNVACDCTPEGLYAAQGNAVFRVTGLQKDSISVFDGDSDEARMLSVPVGGRQ